MIEVLVTASGLLVSGASYADVTAAIVPAVYAEPEPTPDGNAALPGALAPAVLVPAWTPQLAVEDGWPIAVGGGQTSAVPADGFPIRFAVEAGAEVALTAFVAGGDGVGAIQVGPWRFDPADATLDGVVSVTDLLAFLGRFRAAPYDFDGDGAADTADLLAYLGAFRRSTT